MDSDGYLTEIPSYLKQLARLMAKGFFQIEDALIVDVLVRNVCMKEKEIEDLLKFDMKLLRARLATLKNEKFVQTRLRMETGPDSKAQKVNYYFINYRNLVNVIKYKLDHMRKKMETQERDATNRASFKCTNCTKTFTDLEAGELFDPVTTNFYCTFCRQLVEEDASAVVPKDSRLLLARFNDQLQIIFDLLQRAENVKLAPELLDPEPPKSYNDHGGIRDGRSDRIGIWSGEATRSSGGIDQTRIDITIGEDSSKPKEEKKERPVWLMESTIGGRYGDKPDQMAADADLVDSGSTVDKSAQREEIMSVLLAYEKRGTGAGSSKKPMIPETNASDSEEDMDTMNIPTHANFSGETSTNDVEVMEDDEDDDSVPLVNVGADKIPLTSITEDVIARMTPGEKEVYVQLYQDFYYE